MFFGKYFQAAHVIDIAEHVVEVFPSVVVYQFSQAVHVLFVQLYLYHALHVNPQVVADVHALVQL